MTLPACIALAAIFILLPFLVKSRFASPPVVEKAKSYVVRQLLNSDGLIETYPYRAEKIPYRSDYKREALSETAGLWLQTLVLTRDRPKFEAQFQTIRKFFLLPDGTLSWRLELKGNQWVPAGESATLDDLRIIRALLEAADKWQEPKYSVFALKLASAMKEHAVFHNYLLAYPFNDNELEDLMVDLSYLDLTGLAMLIPYDSGWKALYEQSLALLIKGQRPNGFIFHQYNPQKNSFIDADKNMVNYLLSAIYLAERGINVSRFLEFLKKEWYGKGRIFGRYDPVTEIPVVDYESVAVYALVMRLALITHEKGLAQEIQVKILNSAKPQSHPLWKNSLCGDGCHAFDHLQALLSFLSDPRTTK